MNGFDWTAFLTLAEELLEQRERSNVIADYENRYPNPVAHARLVVRLAARLLADLRDLQLSSRDV
ncbi:MAG TPA: hypothetical protein VGR16_12850 [Thermomicrobiales bacterium]|nr:hypothetical protein [Thermomicrobiales bacterium]